MSIFSEFRTPGRDDDHAARLLLFGAAVSAVVVGALAVSAKGRRPSQGDRRRPSDDAPRQLSGQASGGHATGRKTVLIARPKADLYAFWKDFQNLPGFMENIRSVETNGRLSTWTIAAPAGRTVTAEVELIDDRPDERLAWKSVPSSPIETQGSVSFRDAPAGRGTYVEAIVDYRPPAGELGKLVAALFRREPDVQARHELKRFKMLMEAGEVATSARQRGQA